ncbi:MAG: putative methyltransferase [Acidobacteria bacterium]|nr:putative methyltransferase [Acidobacteriota bacterium]
MSDPTRRFSSRVDNYVKYRPGYPREVIKLLAAECGLTRTAVVADVGSGTGIFSELLLQNGNRVYGVEPNQAMREAAERLLQDYPVFNSIVGAAERTTLADHSVDLVTAGQAFHWFDQAKARQEFRRILRRDGWVALIWNERRLDSSEFLRALEALLVSFGTDYEQVRHENVYEDIAAFFGANALNTATFENLQHLDFRGLEGRICSASYCPEPGHPRFELMLESLRTIFRTYAKDGKVTIEYDTKVYYGQLNNLS